MDESTVRAHLVRHWEYSGRDEDIAHEIFNEDAVLEFPPIRRAVRRRRELS